MIPKRLLGIKPLLILLSFGLICRDLGPISNRLEGILLFTVLVIYVVANHPLRNWRASRYGVILNPVTSLLLKLILPYTVFTAAALFIARLSNDLLQIIALTAFLFGLRWFARRRDEPSDGHLVSIVTTIFFAFTIFLHHYFADGWYVVQSYSSLFSTVCSFIYATLLNLGPTSFGFFIFISFILYHIVIFGLSVNRSVARLFIAAVWLFTVTIVVVGINLLSLHLLIRSSLAIDRNDLHTQLIVFLLSAPSILLYRDVEIRKIPMLPCTVIYKAIIPCFCAFAAIITISIIPFMSAEPLEGKRVAFYEKGSLDWNVPRFGTYGQRSGGMFGLMPRHLRVMGADAVMVTELSPASLSRSDVLVMINLNQPLKREELMAVWGFVRSGGGLLILGDHTNLAGLMVNFNKVLEIVNIRFKFDSAMPTRYTWDSLMDERPHPVSGHFTTETSRSWWVGASVECSPPAEPVVVGKYCYSDWGYKNNQKNAYLGNRKFDYYEPLNDQVLAAYSRYGKGRVMVCGDTSSFHNTTFMITHPFVVNTFKFLGDGRAARGVWFNRSLLIALTFLCVFCGLILFREGGGLMLPVSFTAVITIALIATIYGSGYKKPDTLPYEKLKIASIDYSHNGRFDLMSWEDDSIGGFRNNLIRNGFFPTLLRKFDRERLFQAKLFITIAPAQRYSSGEVALLREFVKKGGRLVMAVGWEEMEASLPLLESFGLGIDGIPLGWCQADYKERKVRFHEAWPVIFSPSDDTAVICEPLGYPAIVTRRYGDGHVVLIADSYFLLNENLEGSKKFSVPNIILLRDLLLN